MTMKRHFGEHHNEIVHLSELMLATWRRADPRSVVATHPASFVETFTDMAKAVVADRYHDDECEGCNLCDESLMDLDPMEKYLIRIFPDRETTKS